MGDVTQGVIDKVVDKLDAVSDAAIEAIDATQDAGFDQLSDLVDTGDQLGDLAVEKLKNAKERAEAVVRAYAKILGAISPV